LAELKLILLGTPRIELDGEPVATERRKAVALLAYLAVTAVPHSRESLAAMFWPESDQSSAYAYLRRTLWEINQMLNDSWLHIDREIAALPLTENVWLDTDVFKKLANSQERADLTEAVALYRGEFMAGFTLRDAPDFDNWQLMERESWQREMGRCLQQLVDLCAQDQDWETAVIHAHHWLALDPLNEVAHRRLMRVYAKSGQRAAALAQYEKCETVLEEELGVSPEPATVALWQAIKAGDISGQVEESAPAPVSKRQVPASHNLPEQPMPFVGRIQELDEIEQMLALPETRLLTFVGQGGSGKTRLAIETARRCLNQDMPLFSDGIYFVPLGWLDSPDSVLSTVAYTLNFNFFNDESVDSLTQLLGYLSSKKMLLVLDNYEHLLGEAGLDLPVAILAQAPGVKMLTTSRVRLNVRGEQIYQVAGMRLPDVESDVTWDDPKVANEFSAVRLFCQQAQRIQPDFSLTAENVTDVVRICQFVNGLPLGIELAVAWLPLLSPAEIAAEIKRNLDFLTTEQRDVPQRQRSLRAVFESSWNLLSPEEQNVYQKLSIFRGSFSREAAQDVAGASLHDLMALFNKSLVWREGNGRFQLHELLRQYAAERLHANGDLYAPVIARFSQYFLEFLRTQTEIMKGPAQKTAFDAVEMEEENVKLAWLWAVERGEYQLARSVMNGLLIFYMARSLYKDLNVLLKAGLDTVETAVAAGQNDRETRLMRVTIMAYLGWTAVDEFSKYAPNHLAEQAMPLVQELEAQAELGLGYVMLTSIYTWTVDREVGLQYFRDSIQMIRDSGDRHTLAMALSVLGGTLTSLTHWEEARELLAEAIEINRQLRNRFMLAISLQTLGYAEGISRNYERAFQIYEECQQIYLELNVLRGAASICFDMGEVSSAMGQYRQGMDWLVSARDLYEKCGDRHRVADTYSWQSIMAMRLGDLETAVTLRQKALQAYQQIQDRSGEAWSFWEWGEIYRAQERFDDARHMYEQSHPIFQDTDDTWGIVYYHRGLGEMALQKGDVDKAQTHFKQSLAGLEREYHPWCEAYVQSALSRVYAEKGNLDGARENLARAVDNALTQGDKGLVLYLFYSMVVYLLAAERTSEAAALAAYDSSHIAAWWETRQRVRGVLDVLADKLTSEEMQAALVQYQLVSLDEMIELVQDGVS
jgi:DNA-binding SARP family transcriptional activator/predicted ATPase